MDVMYIVLHILTILHICAQKNHCVGSVHKIGSILMARCWRIGSMIGPQLGSQLSSKDNIGVARLKLMNMLSKIYHIG